MTLRAVSRAVVAILALLMTAFSAGAQSAADFYKGKTVELYIGYSVGGGYDLYARVLARHFGKHIPGNPTVVPKNMEGAGSLRLANWMAHVAPRDGTVFGTVGRGVPFDTLLGLPGAQFKATDFSWIGSANSEVSICASWGTSKITKIEDVFTRQMVIGGTGPTDDTVQFPRVLNGVLDTKFKIISGYPGGNDVVLAMERGEIEGRCGWSWSTIHATHSDWVRDKKIHLLAQLSLEKHPDLPDVPLVADLAKTPEQKSIIRLIFARQVVGRPYFAPPGVPKERIDILRKAFMETMADPEFLADAEKAQLEITPVSGEKIEALIREVYATPAEVAKKAGALLR
ncbi:MAG TPA: tripartite tricarboxylate transporter substrate-binding protein [Pseudolabrys sp.]|nr:tripartite tricarboxylate transporter substrate-binding protein [Pseudolabrys sp.]